MKTYSPLVKEPKEEGLFIVHGINSADKLEAVAGRFRRGRSYIYLDTRIIPNEKVLVVYVHTHPRSGEPSFPDDYPFSRRGINERKAAAWSMIITKNQIYLISPNQTEPGYIIFDVSDAIQDASDISNPRP